MNPTRLCALAAALALAAVAAGSRLSGQQPPPAIPAGPPLTLDQAIELALVGNELSGVAAARLERAVALRRQAIAQFLPALTITANATRRAREVTRLIDGDEVTVLYTHPSDGWTKPLTRATFTHGGCASAWATGQNVTAR